VNWPISPEQNCSRWEPGVCTECEVPVSFLGELTNKTFAHQCTHMKDGAKVHVMFESLYITINNAEPDNKVWNTWITASVSGLDPCTRCSMSRISPGLGNPNIPQNQVQLDYHWKEFNFDGYTKAIGGTAQVQLVLNHCQAGDHPTTCDSSPLGPVQIAKTCPTTDFPSRIRHHQRKYALLLSNSQRNPFPALSISEAECFVSTREYRRIARAVKGLRFAPMNALAGALDSAGRPGRQVHSAAPFGRRKNSKQENAHGNSRSDHRVLQPFPSRTARIPSQPKAVLRAGRTERTGSVHQDPRSSLANLSSPSAARCSGIGWKRSIGTRIAGVTTMGKKT
jgi:hypothetical protein